MTPWGEPSAEFQSRMVRALSPEAIWALSFRQATDSTSPEWPASSRMAEPASRSQILTPLAEPAAARLPSGPTARAWTPAAWSERLASPGAGHLPEPGRLVESAGEDAPAVRARLHGQDE